MEDFRQSAQHDAAPPAEEEEASKPDRCVASAGVCSRAEPRAWTGRLQVFAERAAPVGKERIGVMANVHLWGRLSDLWKGFVSLWLEDIEKNRPEIAYESAVQSMTDKYLSLKRATAAILRRREELEERLGEEQRALARINQDLDAAIDNGQDDLGVILVQKKKALEASVNELTAGLTQAKADVDEAKSSLMNAKAEIEKLEGEKDRMLAEFQSAQARLKIENQLQGLAVDADVAALESVRAHIENTEAGAKLSQGTGSVTAKSELEALKAARAAQLAHVKKSL
jgi:phage shock protein A